FDLERGEKGSNREHIEMAQFKKQTLEKDIDFLEKSLVVKKDELSAYSNKVDSNLSVKTKRAMRNVEVPTGEKSIFGKEKTKTKKKPNKNIIIKKRDNKKLMTAEKDKEKLKKHVNNFLNTDMAKRYKKLSREHEKVKEKYNDLV